MLSTLNTHDPHHSAQVRRSRLLWALVALLGCREVCTAHLSAAALRATTSRVTAASRASPPLHTRGREIVDAKDAVVQLACINWSGGESQVSSGIQSGCDAAPCFASTFFAHNRCAPLFDQLVCRSAGLCRGGPAQADHHRHHSPDHRRRFQLHTAALLGRAIPHESCRT